MEQENNVIETEQTPTENGNTQKEDKTFTQDEVNHIVESRLKRERDKQSAEPDSKEQDLIERERKLIEREMRIDASERLKQEGLPAEFIDLLNLTDKKACDKSVEVAHKIHKAITGNDRKPKKTGRTPYLGGGRTLSSDKEEEIRKAFIIE